jgi:translin
MENLQNITNQIEKSLDEKDMIREVALKSSRAITRISTSVIQKMHMGEDINSLLNEAKDEASRLRSLLQDHTDLFHSGFVSNALQELCEAAIISAITKGEDLPEPKELHATNTAYLLGMGDAIGELRRFALDSLREGEVDKASDYLKKMERFYEELLRFNYPNALVSIRRRQDVARGLIEKTRGEIAVAVRGQALEKKIEELKGKF